MSNKIMPLVSIITPGWNGRKFIHRLLDSILSQTYYNMEYIYVDDGSTDGTKDVVLSYKDIFEQKGISFLYVYKENGGLCSAIQEGLKYVKGKYLCWPEYDDILLPTAIEERVDYLESHPDCAVVTCDAWITPEKDLEHPTGVLSFKNPNRFDRNHFVQLLTGKSIFTAACHMVRMEAFDDTHNNREIYQSKIGAIWQMLLPIYYKYNRGFIDKPLVKWVQRQDSISNKKSSIEEIRKGSEELLDIRLKVLDVIDMSEEDRLFYKELTHKDNAMSKMRKGLKLRDSELFYQGYNCIKRYNANISPVIQLMKKEMDSSIIYRMVCFHAQVLEKMKRLPLKLMTR